MDALALIDAWPVENAAVGVVSAEGVLARRGAEDRVFPWASVTKLVSAGAVLVAAEEGIVELDEPAGPPGATLRHLLSHASGLPLDGERPLTGPGTRRIYSTRGSSSPPPSSPSARRCRSSDYLAAAVLEPVGMTARLDGSPAHAVAGSLADLLAFGRELLAPRFLAEETLAEATTVAFPGLAGVLPGYGRQDPNDWGLGFELRDGKSPHWTGDAELAADVRPLRPGRDVPVGRSGGGARVRVPDGSRLRRLVAGSVAGARSDAVLGEAFGAATR